jgi:hypothetical protein
LVAHAYLLLLKVKNFLEYIFCRDKNQEKNDSRSPKLRPDEAEPTNRLMRCVFPDEKYHLRET